MAERIRVEVAVALPDEQVLLEVELDSGATVADAVRVAEVSRHFPELELDDRRLGVFGRRRPPEHVLEDGDRVEIYRPLKADPKEIRRQMAALERFRGKP